MSKIYLQEKIEAVPGQYVVVGEDGFLKAGRIESEANPQIIITAPSGYSVSNFSATCNNNAKNIEFEKLSDTTFSCFVPEFGLWKIIATKDNTVLEDFIDVPSISTYQVNLTSSGDDSGGGSGGGGGGSDVPTTLEDTSWATISSTVSNGLASSYWSVGDRKSVQLKNNSKMGNVTFTNNYVIYAYIIGLDHNAEIEAPGMTLQFGFPSNLNDAKNYAFVDSNYGNSIQEDNGCFHMNYNSSFYGWYNSMARNGFLNGGTNSFLTCLPDDLVAVCTAKPIYTDNASGTGSDKASSVTSTKDKVFLLSEYEIFGTRTYANLYEQELQKQYTYYKTYSKVKYRHNSPSNTCVYWTRSKRNTTSTSSYPYCSVSTSGSINSSSSFISYGIAPVIHIGSTIPTSTNIYISNPGNNTTNRNTVSSYIKIGNTTHYSEGKLSVSPGDVIKVYGKRATYTGSWFGISYSVDVGLKINGVAQPTTTGNVDNPSYTSYVQLGTYTVPNDLKGLITVSLQYFTAGDGDALFTYYVTITTE